MSNLRAIVGEKVPVTTDVHGTRADTETPASITSRRRAPDGKYSDGLKPSVADNQVGHYTEVVDTTGFSYGIHEIAHTIVLSTGETQRITHTIEVRK